MTHANLRAYSLTFVILGVIFLTFCVGRIAWLSLGPGQTVTAETCEKAVPKDRLIPDETTDRQGQLRITGIFPKTISVNKRLCLVVAGVTADAARKPLEEEVVRAKKALDEAMLLPETSPGEKQKKEEAQKNANTRLNAALIALNNGLPPVDVALYFDNRRATGLTTKAQATSDVQYLMFDLKPSADATTDEAKFWRGLFGQNIREGRTNVAIGISRGAGATADTPQLPAKETVEFVVYLIGPSIAGGLGLIFLTLALGLYAATSSLLRDNSLTGQDAETLHNAPGTPQPVKDELANAAALIAARRTAAEAASADATKAGELYEALRTPIGSFSLARVQMAFWFVLTLAGFGFIWLTTGQFLKVVTPEILALIGIQAATGLTAISLNAEAEKTSVTRGFVTDILTDDVGPKLQRLQVLTWTLVLAVVFVWTVISSFGFPAFDNNLLLLMGIFNSTYLGFKFAAKSPGG